MDEYIKREAVIDLITRRYENPEICTQEINSIPAADVVPVVRCEKCTFSQSDGWVCGGTVLMPPHQTFPDSFCECGVKMDRGVE